MAKDIPYFFDRICIIITN